MEGKYKDPYCRLVKALYGHPESGGHWERHFTEAIRKVGGALVRSHPSSFWFPDSRLLLTVYVDDLLLSGPVQNPARKWEEIRQPFSLDPTDELDTFLGRK